MRIATSEQDRSSDGEFYKNMSIKYNQIKLFGVPLYESNMGSGILKMLLDDNRPLRQEDAYCNMYLFRSQSEAKKFQDGTANASTLKYDLDRQQNTTQQNTHSKANRHSLITGKSYETLHSAPSCPFYTYNLFMRQK